MAATLRLFVEPFRLLGRLVLAMAGMGWTIEDAEDLWSAASYLSALAATRGLALGILRKDATCGLLPVSEDAATELLRFFNEEAKENETLRRAWWFVGEEKIEEIVAEAWSAECARRLQ
jgi:hypothetical protein